MIAIKNQMLNAMQLTQQDIARMDNYTLQSLSIMLNDRYNFFSSLIDASKVSGGRQESTQTT